mmetsp:Transcript_7557/g.18728  ORF Transcript_7557/g.18728 Transcript_7557/m.18728 type:complete len:472 (+) Transcript_7557:143-1558(+)
MDYGSTKSVQLSDAFNALPVGRWHYLHMLRQMLAWSIFAVTQESTAYVFDGFRRSFDTSEQELAHFASAFYAGSLGGAALASVAIDSVGRRKLALLVVPIGIACASLMLTADSFATIVLLRGGQAVYFGIALTALATWYPEFLPTESRGPLMAAVSLGWPAGRAAVIIIAKISEDSWRPVIVASIVGWLVLGLVIFMAPESPRFLLSTGDVRAAGQVVRSMYDASGWGMRWDESTLLRLSADAAGHLPTKTLQARLYLLGKSYRLVLFSLLLFAILSATTVLIDTFGPGILKSLITPGSAELPHEVLFLFNIGDCLGIVTSTVVADHIGRKGSFMVGFYLQGLLFGAMALLGKLRPPVGPLSPTPPLETRLMVILGVLGSGCRCFGWEAAQFWTLEAFGTETRGLAFGFTTAVMRLFSVASLEIYVKLIDKISASTALLAFAGMLLLGGLVTQASIPMETAGLPMAESCGA